MASGNRCGGQVRRVPRALWLGAVAFALVLLGGCAVAPQTQTQTRPRTPATPGARPAQTPAQTPAPIQAKPDRDTLVTDMARCHMLRVSQARDAGVTDTAVVAAMTRYRISPEQVAARATDLLPAARANGQAFAQAGERACFRLAQITGVASRLTRPKSVPQSTPRSTPKSVQGTQAGGVWVRFEGEIGPGLANKLAVRLRQEGAAGLIINSPGGNVYEARKLGRHLRAQGLKVAVDKVCASACIDVLAGGVSRYITSAARIGIHQSSAPSSVGNHNTGQSYVASSALYLREMGIDPDLALAAASVPPNKMYWISTSEAIKTRLATDLVRGL